MTKRLLIATILLLCAAQMPAQPKRHRVRHVIVEILLVPVHILGVVYWIAVPK